MNSTDSDVDEATRDRRPQGLMALAAIWAVATLVLFFAVRPTMSLALHWDEVDYVVAARQGIVANATDASALSAADFVEFVRAKYQGLIPRVRPEYAESRDVFLLRHTHPPLLHYALALLGPERLAPGHEAAQRFVQFAGGAALIGTMLWGYAVMASRRSLAGMITVAASGVLGAFYLSRELNCHLWVALMLMPASLAVGRFMREPALPSGLIAGAALALAFLGLQTGLFAAFWAVVALGISTFVPTVGRSGAEEVRNLRRLTGLWIKHTAWMVAGFFAALMVTYPGAVTHLSLLRILALYAYLIGGGSEYAHTTAVKLQILPLILPILVLGLIGVAGLVLRRDRASRHFLLATAVIGLGYGLIMQKFLLNVTYVTPALMHLSVPGAVVIASWHSKPAQWCAAGLMVACSAWNIATFAPTGLTHTSVAQVRSLGDLIGPRHAWVQGAHVLKYYRPDLAGQIGSISLAENGSVLTTRDHKAFRYVPITDERIAGSVVMLGVFSRKPNYQWEKRLPAAMRMLDSPVGTGRIYVLPDIMPARADSTTTP